eukprot:gene3607-30199_t
MSVKSNSACQAKTNTIPANVDPFGLRQSLEACPKDVLVGVVDELLRLSADSKLAVVAVTYLGLHAPADLRGTPRLRILEAALKEAAGEEFLTTTTTTAGGIQTLWDLYERLVRGGCLDRLEDAEVFGTQLDRRSASFEAEVAALRRTVATLSEEQFPGTGIMSGFRAKELLDVIEPPKQEQEEEAMTTVDVYLAALQRIGGSKAGI